ncbi:MAG: DUF2589 domain-containing protein [Nitrosopumilus sp.]|nr:DUF2589 domain-containing protein [Nitrosopumilus sp.]
MSAKLPSDLSEKAFPIENLISAPINAIIEAQAIAIQSALDFITEVGLESNSKLKKSKIRTVEFTYSHPVPDPNNPGMVIDTPSKVSIPLLSLVQIPNISISESTLDFNINIVGLPENKAKTTSKTKLPFIVQSKFAPRIQATPERPQEPHTLSLSIKLKKEESSEAERKIMNLLQEAITSHPIESKSGKTDITELSKTPATKTKTSKTPATKTKTSKTPATKTKTSKTPATKTKTSKTPAKRKSIKS